MSTHVRYFSPLDLKSFQPLLSILFAILTPKLQNCPKCRPLAIKKSFEDKVKCITHYHVVAVVMNIGRYSGCTIFYSVDAVTAFTDEDKMP